MVTFLIVELILFINKYENLGASGIFQKMENFVLINVDWIYFFGAFLNQSFHYSVIK